MTDDHYLVVEYDIGERRHGRYPLIYAYGYISGTTGLDGEEEDVVFGWDDRSDNVLVSHVADSKSPLGYERKLCFFFSTEAEAVTALETMYPRNMILSYYWHPLKSLTFLHGAVILNDRTIYLSDYDGESGMRLYIDDDYDVVKSEVPRGTEKGGKYAARIQIGVEKDGSPMYRYFQSTSDYKKYLKKVGRSKDAEKRAKESKKEGKKLGDKVKQQAHKKEDEDSKSVSKALPLTLSEDSWDIELTLLGDK